MILFLNDIDTPFFVRFQKKIGKALSWLTLTLACAIITAGSIVEIPHAPASIHRAHGFVPGTGSSG